ncbi:MAG: DUF4406 domain-containing protein [Candidatus Komeilibacteria bacterium]|nr:DUF4406 domain-containing protein [Candidatus Komeilibacteria bacterium]
MEKKLKMIYLAGKLSGFKLWNYLVAWQYARKLWRQGLIVYSPHLNETGINVNLLTYEEWMERDFDVIKRVDEVYMLPNWKKSAGAIREHFFAHQINKLINYL